MMRSVSQVSRLIEQAAENGLINDPALLNEFRQQIHSDPLELASSIEDTFSRQIFRAKLAEIFRNISGDCTDCHKEISKLGLRGIVTLNYDDGHEVAYSSRGRKPNSGRSQDHATMTRWMQGDVFEAADYPILHFHGDVSDPSKMIFTADDYTEFYSSPFPNQLITHLWRSQRLLVIGFGFSDPFLTRVVEGALRALPTDSRHFALIGREEGQPVSPNQRRMFAKKFRLNPIFYEIRGAFGHSNVDHSDLIKIICRLYRDAPTGQLRSTEVVTVVGAVNANVRASDQTIIQLSAEQRAKAEFERDLFVAPNNNVLYVEPRLHRLTDTASPVRADAIDVSIEEIVFDTGSYIIGARSEFGGTTLSRRLIKDFAAAGKKAIYADAARLPNYKKKLLEHFDANSVSRGDKVTLVLDGFDLSENERMLKEIIGTQLFDRLIVISKISMFGANNNVLLDQFAVKFQVVMMSALTPADIRTLASQFFDVNDDHLLSSTIHKIYADFNALCIPNTPSNVIMYMTILHREGGFTPINRVQIVARYLAECLRRPSDEFVDAFTARNKIDVVSSFIFELHRSDKGAWTEADWFIFCRQYMDATLTQFDDAALLNELLASRILIRSGGNLFCKYRFFYVFFVGRYIATHPKILADCISSGMYLKHAGLVEVISELSADNELLVCDISQKLNAALDEFGVRYVPERFDPFVGLEWPGEAKEEEQLWKPLNKLVADGPRNPEEIDEIKRSLVGEHRATNQVVVVQTYDQLERRLIGLHRAIVEVLRNSDSLRGEVKKSAVLTAFKAYLRIYQVGLLFAPVIAKMPYFFWHGIVFSNEIQYEEADDEAKRVSKTFPGVLEGVLAKASDEMGSRKLGEVFKLLSRDAGVNGFIKWINFNCLIRAKPKGWTSAATASITSTGRRTFGLMSLLSLTIRQFRDEVNTGSEREELKKLIAAIRMKRDLNKDNPGKRDLERVVNRLQETNYFERLTAEQKNERLTGPDTGLETKS